MKKLFLIGIVLVGLLFFGCTQIPPLQQPTVVSSPVVPVAPTATPTLTPLPTVAPEPTPKTYAQVKVNKFTLKAAEINYAAFDKLNLTKEFGCDDNQNEKSRCVMSELRAGASNFTKCDRLLDVKSAAWLEPALPMQYCTYGYADVSEAEIENKEREFVKVGRGRGVSAFTRYVVLGAVKPSFVRTLIKNPEAFREFFAPVDSPEEAVAFADLLNPLEENTFADPSGETLTAKEKLFYAAKEEGVSYAYLVPEVDGTHAKAVGDGFDVNLFHVPLFGCGGHNLEEVVFHVSKDGAVEEKERRTIALLEGGAWCVD